LCLPAGQDAQPVKNSYASVDDKESFATVHGRMVPAKAGIMKRQMDMLEERYDLSDHSNEWRGDGSHETGAGKGAKACGSY
jgi:hypothetical protein